VLVGVEFSSLDEVALRAAAAVAQRANTERIHLVHAVEMVETWPLVPFDYGGLELDTVYKAAIDSATEQLERIEPPRTRAKITREVRVGPAGRELAKAADEINADLSVIASHDRRAFKRMALGSVAGSLLRTSARPMLIVGKDRPGGRAIERVLAAIDLSPASKDVLEHATRIAHLYGGSVRVLSLYETPYVAPEVEKALFPSIELKLKAIETAHRQKIEALVNELRDPLVETKIEVMSKAPVHNAIIDVAGIISSDLVVIGTSGHNAWHQFFLGSTATHVVTEAPCPVLAVPHAEARRKEQPHERAEPAQRDIPRQKKAV